MKSEDLSSSTQLSVAEAATQRPVSYAATARTEKGQRLATVRVERYPKPALGHLRIQRVAADDLRRYRLWLERHGRFSAQTVAHVLSDARCSLNWCWDSGYLDRSPVARRLLPRIQERPADRLSDLEIAAVVAIPEPYGFIVRLGLGTGLRWGELVRAQASYLGRGMLVVAHTKSGRIRRVPLDPEPPGRDPRPRISAGSWPTRRPVVGPSPGWSSGYLASGALTPTSCDTRSLAASSNGVVVSPPFRRSSSTRRL